MTIANHRRAYALAAILAGLVPAALSAQPTAEEAAAARAAMEEQMAERLANVEVTAEELTPNVAVLFGAGGNIGVSHGPDGTVLIDDQFAPLTGRIQAAIEGLGAEPTRFLVNTHWHWDHTGGNENIGETGAVIMAHENVRIRLARGSEGERSVPPAPPVALPVLTYEDGVKLHLNGDTIRLVHMHNAHTDGDTVLIWEEANIVHMGDIFFNRTTLPYIDRDSGGSAQGVLAAVEAVLDMTDAETRFIPGHGPMAVRADFVAYRDMLADVIGRVQAAIDAGHSLEEIQAMGIADAYEVPDAFIGAEAFIGAVHDSLTDPDAMAHRHADGTAHAH